jgi:hypothetical protein
MRILAPGLALVIACALASCGDAASDALPSDEQQIRAVVVDGLTTLDRNACRNRFTPAYIRQITGARGRAGRSACRRIVAGRVLTADEATVAAVRLRGSRASAEARPQGLNRPFRTLDVALRERSGRWRIDRVTDGKLDRVRFFAFARRELPLLVGELPESIVDCVLRDFKSTDDQTLARALIRADLRIFVVPTLVCGARDRHTTPLPASIRTCWARGMRAELRSGPLARQLAANRDNLSILESQSLARAARRTLVPCLAL